MNNLQLDFKVIDKNIVEYPYLKTFFLPKIIAIDTELSKTTHKINRYYFLFLILSNQNELYLSIEKCYQKLIETNLFSIPYALSSFLTPETVKSDGFKKFAFVSANWHTKSEIIIFYLSLLNYYYGVNLNFNFSSTSVDKNLDNSIKIFSKQNILKLGGYICRKLTDESGLNGINQNKLILFFSTALSFGINLEGMFQFSIIPYVQIIGKALFTVLLCKIGNKMEKKSHDELFLKITNRISELNDQLDSIMTKQIDCMKHKMINDINEEIISVSLDVKTRITMRNSISTENIDQSMKELIDEIKEYLKNVEINEDFEFEIAKEIKSEEYEDNWVNIKYD